MKTVFSVLILLLFVGCGEGNKKEKISLLHADTTKVNPNSLSYRALEKSEDRKNRLAISKIEADAKIKIAQIESQQKLQVAKIDAQTKKEIAKTDSLTAITTSKIDATTQKESMHYMLYIVLIVILFLIIAAILLYLNSKKNRELQRKLHEEKLRHEQALREKELEEQRLHKILDLAAQGKLPDSIQEEVLLSISAPKKGNILEAHVSDKKQ